MSRVDRWTDIREGHHLYTDIPVQVKVLVQDKRQLFQHHPFGKHAIKPFERVKVKEGRRRRSRIIFDSDEDDDDYDMYMMIHDNNKEDAVDEEVVGHQREEDGIMYLYKEC